MFASALLAVVASQAASPVLRNAARALTVVPQTLAATLIGAWTVIGTPRLLSAEIWLSFRKFFRMSTFCTLTATRPLPLPVLVWATAAPESVATAAAANRILRIHILQLSHEKTGRADTPPPFFPPRIGQVERLNAAKSLFLHGLRRGEPRAGQLASAGRQSPNVPNVRSDEAFCRERKV